MHLAVTTTDAQQLKSIKSHLESLHVLNKQKKIDRIDGHYRLYTTVPAGSSLLAGYSVEEYAHEAQPNTLATHIHSFFGNSPSIPRKWYVYPPMVLFSANSFADWDLTAIDQNFYKHLLEFFPGCTHVALNNPIEKTDEMRRPWNIVPLYGDFGSRPKGSERRRMNDIPDSLCSTNPKDYHEIDFSSGFWVSVVQNGISQNWAPMYTMFSRGNIKEKKRVLQMPNIKGKVVFDLYCGIGYFSLSYLASGCESIFCWDINPWSVEGFRRSLGKYKHRIFTEDDVFDYETYLQLKESGVQVFIFCESNTKVSYRMRSFPDGSLAVGHINLGLLPSSRDSWETCKEIGERISKEDVCAHIHENVHKDEFGGFRGEVEGFFGWRAVHLEKVKTFAPDVWHVVVDTTSERAMSERAERVNE